MAHERRNAGLAAEQQRGLTITYDGIVVGEDLADPIVERVLLVELKAVNALNVAHHAQRIDYLKTFGPRSGSLLNFGMKRLEIKRVANTGQTAPSAQFAASPCLSALDSCLCLLAKVPTTRCTGP